MGDNPKGLTLEASHLEHFKRILTEEQGKIWSIVVARIDPDGVGSAKGLKAILESLGFEARIFASGTVGHPQNKTIYETYDLAGEVRPLTELPQEGPVALVDSSKLEDSRFGIKIACERFRIIVDHHQDPTSIGRDGKNRFVWVVPVGSASTLISLLAKALEVTLDEKVATLLAVGIHTDTEELTSLYTAQQDLQAFADMLKAGSREEFHKCSRYLLTARSRDLMLKTFAHAVEIDEYLLAHPNELLLDDDGDYLSIFATRLLRYEGPHTAIVWGIAGNEVRVSVRTRSPSLNLTTRLEELFGKNTGGAKHGAGGASVPLGALAPTDRTAAQLIGFLEQTYIERLEKVVGVRQKPKPSA